MGRNKGSTVGTQGVVGGEAMVPAVVGTQGVVGGEAMVPAVVSMVQGMKAVARMGPEAPLAMEGVGRGEGLLAVMVAVLVAMEEGRLCKTRRLAHTRLSC